MSWWRIGLVLPLVGVWVAAAYLAGHWWRWLEESRLAGVMVIGLLFSLIAIFGRWLAAGEDFISPASRQPGRLLRQYRRCLGQMALFLPLFLGGIWVTLILAQVTVGRWWPAAAPIAALFLFIGYIRLVLWLLKQLSERM